MAKEIERKYLVDLSKIDISELEKLNIQQGYISKDLDKSIRIRIQNDKGFLTIKTKTINITREEYEYEIPYQDAIELIKICGKTIFKKRTIVHHKDKEWYIDVFEGDNEGLIIAEIELENEEETFDIPEWIVKEISHNKRYYNSNLINHPYSLWKK